MKRGIIRIIGLILVSGYLLRGNSLGSGTETLPSSETFVNIAKESLPAVVSLSVTKRREKVVLKQWKEKLPRERKEGTVPEEVPFEFFEKFFGEELPFIFEEKEMEVPAAGSGLNISPDGYIITNNHIVAEAKENTLEVKLKDGRKFIGKEVKIVGTDPLTDLAVLKINAAGLKTIPWGDSDKLEIGEWVLAVGNPFELSGSVTQGIVSAKHRVIYKAVLEDLIQTTALINPGSSGGPLINLKGEVVGINTAIATRSGVWQGVGFAIPAKIAQKVAEEIIKYGHVRQGWIGIVMHKVDAELAKFFGLPKAEGVLVMDVIPESPAGKAGIKRYDIILALNDEAIKSSLDLLQKTASKESGEKVVLKIARLQDGEKKEITLELNLGARPGEKELAKLQEAKKIPRVYDELGLRLAELKEVGAAGMEITEVKTQSPAEKAGLEAGDIILEINTRQISGLEDYRHAIKAPKNGVLLVRYLREGKEELTVVEVK